MIDLYYSVLNKYGEGDYILIDNYRTLKEAKLNADLITEPLIPLVNNSETFLVCAVRGKKILYKFELRKARKIITRNGASHYIFVYVKVKKLDQKITKFERAAWAEITNGQAKSVGMEVIAKAIDDYIRSYFDKVFPAEKKNKRNKYEKYISPEVTIDECYNFLTGEWAQYLNNGNPLDYHIKKMIEKKDEIITKEFKKIFKPLLEVEK